MINPRLQQLKACALIAQGIAMFYENEIAKIENAPKYPSGGICVAPNDFDKKVEIKLKDDIPTHLIDALKYSHLQFGASFPQPPTNEVNISELLGSFVRAKHKGSNNSFSTEGVILAVEFAKLVRVLTIEETTAGISARMQKVKTEPNGGSYKPVPWVDERPKENIIKLPKDFTL